MKKQVEVLLYQALRELKLEVQQPKINVGFTKDKSHGDFSANIAMMLAKQVGMNPRELAQKIIDALPQDDMIAKAEIAGPGFINFFLSTDAAFAVVKTILEQKERFGLSDYGKGKKVLVEFVSANPTGPLHVGHGRGAAYGATISDLLAAVGYDVHREYYVNDAGRQMHILAASVWLRYCELLGEQFTFPSNAYKGEYVKDIAKKLQDQKGKALLRSAAEIFADIPADEPQGGDKEKHIDALVQRAKALLGEDYDFVYELGKDDILTDIKEDLSEFGVNFQEWFSERSLEASGAFDEAVKQLTKANALYEKEGATWFKATDYGDEKDRVIIKENGEKTYFANDIPYHLNKYSRGYDYVIDVLGADHHGYAPRIKAMLSALDYDANSFAVLLVQFAILYRGGEKIQMSTRSGSFVTLRELREEVGNDAARFFYVMRKNEQHLDFDLDVAKSQSNDNPMYYIQYAHARICSVFNQLSEKGWQHDQAAGAEHLALLTEPHEQALIDQLNKYAHIVLTSAINYEPHLLVNYLRELANAFHSYYNAQQFLIIDDNLRNSRLNLILATRYVLAGGLVLLGVTAPEKM